MDLPKSYDFSASEKKWVEYWKKKDVYAYKEGSAKQTFSIDTPPPYASADHLHVGHGMHYSQFEFVARYKRMKGFNVFFPMGFDDNGLPTERFVEKKHKVNKGKVSRSEFVKLCLEETRICGQTYYDLFNSLGFSIDWSLLYQTIGERARLAAQKSFLDLYKKNKLYRQDAPVMWDTKLQTTLAQADLEDVEMTSHFNDVAFKVHGKDLVIATTRPELLPACVAVFYHPEDDRYKGLKGKFAKVPLFDFEVPIMSDEKVDSEKGTGIVMCCTFGDKTDIEWWQKHKLPLKIVITKDGKMNKLAGKYEGLSVRDARKQIIEDLKREGLLLRQEEIRHSVNISDRSGAEIEFLKTPQWYIRVLDAKEELIEQGRKVNWYPEHMRVRYEHWVNNLQWDWCISRQRFFGVPFPVWYSKKTGEIIVADEDQLPVDPLADKPKNLPKGHAYKDIIPEEDVMDTWMTSSVSPEINAGWGLKDERKGFLPMSLRPQAHDIIRTWAFYTLVKAYYHHNNIPWKDIMMSGHGQDPHGQKMSKSKGNFLVAQDVIAKYGADSFRYWAATVKLGEDLAYQEKDVVTGKKTVTKIWNASKFTIMNLKDYKAKPLKELKLDGLRVMDKWILSKVMKAVKAATEAFETYEYSKAMREADVLFWHKFCDNYLEFVKHRTYEPKDDKSKLAAQKTLYYSLLNTLKMFAPVMPFITEEVYQMYFKDVEGFESIHVSDWPAFNKDLLFEEEERAGDLAVMVVSSIRKYKSEKGLSLKAELGKVEVSCTDEDRKLLELVIDDVKAVGSVRELVFSKGKEITTKII